ncbi:MAG: N-acetylmuramoyl-L-alanine amidase [Alphaproteobacteria bacterium]
MKVKILPPIVLSLIITTILTPCNGMEDAQISPDPFVNRINELTGLKLTPKKFTSELKGYNLPPFSPAQGNRNHFDDRPEGSFTRIESLVMHYTVCNTPETLDLFTKNIPDGRVSASYVITETDDALGISGGQVIRMMPDDERAWHAGVSSWRGINNLNGTSIGIENVNKGFTDSPGQARVWYPFDPAQIHSLGLLSQAIVRKHNIPPMYVVGHADIAPGRKQDPGILFPWGELYSTYGVGAWLGDEEQSVEAVAKTYSPKELPPRDVNIEFLSTQLQEYGYKIEPTSKPDEHFLNVLKAFKSHFSCNQKPEEYDSQPNENDVRWIWSLNAKYPPREQ